MKDFIIFTLAIMTVALIILPLVGAQRKSLIYSQQLAEKTNEVKLLGDNDCLDDALFFNRVAPSWGLAFLFLLLGPLFAIKQPFAALSKKQIKTKLNETHDEIKELAVKVLFFSNPITMSAALVLVGIALVISSLVIFSILSLQAVTADDDSKLQTASPSPGDAIEQQVASVYNIYKNFRLSH